MEYELDKVLAWLASQDVESLTINLEDGVAAVTATHGAITTVDLSTELL